MASNPPSSGPGQPWPGVPSDTPGVRSSDRRRPSPGSVATATATPATQPVDAAAARASGASSRSSPASGSRDRSRRRASGASSRSNPASGRHRRPPAGRRPTSGASSRSNPASGRRHRQPQPQGQWGQQGQWPPPVAPSQWPPAQQSGWGDPTTAIGGSDYPVDVRFTPEARIGRYWGIPCIGMWLRGLLLLPHIIVLYFVGVVAFLATLLTWIPVLLTGRYPGWGYALVGGYLRWAHAGGRLVHAHVGHLSGVHGRRPRTTSTCVCCSTRSDPSAGSGASPSWASSIRAIILIPHFIVLWLLGILVYILILFAWLPVLIYGRQADLVYNIVGGYFRWYTRVVCVPAAPVRTVSALPSELTHQHARCVRAQAVDVVRRTGTGRPGSGANIEAPPTSRGGFPSPEAPPL